MIRIIDGKTYLHFGVVKAILLIGIIIGVISYAHFLYTVYVNIDVFQRDPIHRGMEMHGFVGCQCTEQSGKLWQVNQTAVYHELGRGPVDPLTILNISQFIKDHESSANN